MRLLKKKIPPQLSQSPIKVITRKVVPKSKTTIKVKPVIIESDDDSPPPTELKAKSSVFDRLGVGDVSSTTPNFDSSNSSTTESRKVIVFFFYIYRLYFKFNYYFNDLLVFSVSTSWNKTDW